MNDNKKVTVGIRADGNAVLGMGHLMRCISIAYAIMEQQMECVFYTAEQGAGNFLQEKGFCARILNTDYKDMEGELSVFEPMLKADGCSLLLVDSYQITQKYLDKLMGYCPVYYLDDTGTGRLNASGVINYNIYGQKLGYETWCSPDTELLLGAAYAPVKKPFIETAYELRPCVKKIMVTMGGSDALNIAGRLCESLLMHLEGNVEIVIICGRFNPHLEKLREMEAKESRVHILVDVPDMWNKMAESDLVISAAGSTMYELSAMGVPTVCCYYVENQRRIADGFAAQLGLCNAGDFSIDSDGVLKRIVAEVEHLTGDAALRSTLSMRMKQVVDGRGAERIACKLGQCVKK